MIVNQRIRAIVSVVLSLLIGAFLGWQPIAWWWSDSQLPGHEGEADFFFLFIPAGIVVFLLAAGVSMLLFLFIFIRGKFVTLQDPTGRIKHAKIGYSGTTLLFGFFPALIRGHWKWAAIQFPIWLLTIGLSNIVFAFFINKLYFKHLLKKGFQPADSTSYAMLVGKKYLP